MCGIAGILLAPSANATERLGAVESMTGTLRHRGPDAQGIWSDPDAGIALGHRRLAIVDLSDAGRQPMLSHRGNLVVSYNGEIYNFETLRADLENRGCRFRGHSDTEIMLAAFDQFGIGPALEKCAGMFAIALWDRQARTLHLIRDRMGKKPLYVAVVQGALLFASELRAFRAFPGFQPRIDPAAVEALLRFGWIPDGLCIWQDVFKLPPGARLEVTAAELEASDISRIRDAVRPWWSLKQVAESGQRHALPCNDSDLTDELDQLLRTVVRERMVADVPLGAFLSGGIDSTAVVAMMQAQSAQPVRTFTIGFHEAGYNEADDAGRIAQHLKTDHTRWDITPAEARAVIPELPRIWDEPFADESQIPTYLVARLARQHVTVALSGDGGDESFGGYRRHATAAQLAGVLALPSPIRRFAAGTADALGAILAHPSINGVPLSPALRKRAKDGDVARLASILRFNDGGALYDSLISVAQRPATAAMVRRQRNDDIVLPDLASHLMYRDMAGYLPGDVLVKLDRASMAVALEGRCPLLDHRVVEFAWRLPLRAKIRGGTSKWLLRQVLRRYVPERLFDRPKAGFNVPIGAWIAGPLRDWAGDLLAGASVRQSALFDREQVERTWRDHATGRADRGRELWALLMFAAWLEAQRDQTDPWTVRDRPDLVPQAA